MAKSHFLLSVVMKGENQGWGSLRNLPKLSKQAKTSIRGSSHVLQDHCPQGWKQLRVWPRYSRKDLATENGIPLRAPSHSEPWAAVLTFGLSSRGRGWGFSQTQPGPQGSLF